MNSLRLALGVLTLALNGLRAAEVGGIINTDTRWTLAESPYHFTRAVQVAQNVTLTIDPGTVIIGDGFELQIFGRLQAVGTPSTRVTFKNTFVDGGNAPYTITCRFCRFTDGGCYYNSDNGGSIVLEDSILERTFSPWIWQSSASNAVVSRNIFLRCQGILVFADQAHFTGEIRNNVFFEPVSRAVQVTGGTLTNVAYNSFLSTDRVALRLSQSFSSAMSAPYNFWNTTNTQVIDLMIFDRSDDLNVSSYISYLPLLLTPHAATPQIPILTITAQPQSQSITGGQHATLSVVAEGVGDLEYQWYANQSLLFGSTNATLNNATEGSYFAIIRDFFGNTITSDVASITVVMSTYALLTATNGLGSVSITPFKTNYSRSDEVQLAAFPARWQAFSQWNDGVTANPRSIMVQSNSSFTAFFIPTVPLETLQFGGVSRLAPVGMPAMFVDGVFVPETNVSARGSATVSMQTTFPNGTLLYTQDGSDPSISARLYDGSFVLNRTRTLRAIAYNADFTQSVQSDPLEIIILPTLTASTEGGGSVAVTRRRALI